MRGSRRSRADAEPSRESRPGVGAVSRRGPTRARRASPTDRPAAPTTAAVTTAATRAAARISHDQAVAPAAVGLAAVAAPCDRAAPSPHRHRPAPAPRAQGAGAMTGRDLRD